MANAERKDLHEIEGELLRLDTRARAAPTHESLWAEEAVFACAFERVRKR
jgi:hypothetical protein